MIDENIYQINLKSVYSSPAKEELADVKLPQNWTLSWHQVETLKRQEQHQLIEMQLKQWSV